MALSTKLKNVIRYTLERMKEPSTWAATGTLLALGHADPDIINKVTQAGSAAPVVAALLLGVFLPEKTQ